MANISTYAWVLFWYVVLILLPGIVFSLLLHFFLSLPMRRRDRALFFLDLVETVLQRGQSIELAILSAAERQDRSIGVGFFLLAANIENGDRLGQALNHTPTFLPPQINSILNAGEKMGDVRKVLPACYEILRLASDTVRMTVQYIFTILLMFTPIAIFLIWLLMVFVVPKLKEVIAGSEAQIWPFSDFVLSIIPALITFEVILFFALLTIAAIYIGGPTFIRWFQFRKFPIVDLIAWRVPWKQKRLQRTFSAMLAVLLDGGVPEAEAVRLAGDCTANEICRRRAKRVITALQNGAKLTDAVRVMDDAGEFHWRLTNATHARGGFLNALHGWHDALDAKAFQQEEATAHAVTSGLVILNGVLVALIATAMFGILIAILNATLAST